MFWKRDLRLFGAEVIFSVRLLAMFVGSAGFGSFPDIFLEFFIINSKVKRVK